jgi:hypothetical protein
MCCAAAEVSSEANADSTRIAQEGAAAAREGMEGPGASNKATMYSNNAQGGNLGGTREGNIGGSNGGNDVASGRGEDNGEGKDGGHRRSIISSIRWVHIKLPCGNALQIGLIRCRACMCGRNSLFGSRAGTANAAGGPVPAAPVGPPGTSGKSR